MFLNPDHVTIAVADAGPAIDFFALLGFREEHVLTIDGGPPARYMGMPGMKAQHITLVLEGANPRFEIQLLEFVPTPGDDPGLRPTNLRERASTTSRSASTTSRPPPRTSWPMA
jgi:catechol 2,3-dioxygenase-like lactoylglutathione lyase family enzyme